MDLKNKTFLITGGASGLGKACALHFAACEANVAILDLNDKDGEALAKTIGSRACFIHTDICQEDSVNNAIKSTIAVFGGTFGAAFGGLHGAVCCAGVAISEKLLNKEGKIHSLDSFKKVIDINIVGTFNVIRLATAAIAKQSTGIPKAPKAVEDQGVFITTASIAAFEGQPGQSAYAASKGGIVAMALPMARELAPLGIRVMVISPGIFDTPMMASLPEKVRLSLGEQVPFPPRLGDPHEFALLAESIVRNPMLNGTVIRLDGALRMGVK